MSTPFDDPKVVESYNKWQAANLIACDATYFRPNNPDNERLWILEEQALDEYSQVYDLWWTNQLASNDNG